MRHGHTARPQLLEYASQLVLRLSHDRVVRCADPTQVVGLLHRSLVVHIPELQKRYRFVFFKRKSRIPSVKNVRGGALP